MQIKVSKVDLEDALTVADIGIAGSGTDLSTHFLFRVSGDDVEILSFHQRICASALVKCQHDGEEGDAFTVEGKRLSRWLGGVGDVAITLTSEDGVVQLKSPRSKIHVKSLDPSKFPFWDGTLGEAKLVGTVPSERLAAAFGYVKNFISDKDTTRPEISQVEVIDGALWATDRKTLTLVTIDGVGEAGLRVHGKDIGSAIKFFGLKGTENVEILEHDRSVFFRRSDGAMVGASRPRTAFPKLKLDRDGIDPMRWEIRTADLVAGIQCLSASADWDNTRVKFNFKDGNVILAVKSASGKEDVYPIEAIEHDGMDDLPDDGFEIDYPYVTHVISHFGGDTLKFGMKEAEPPKKGGYVRFQHGTEKDIFLTAVVWRP